MKIPVFLYKRMLRKTVLAEHAASVCKYLARLGVEIRWNMVGKVDGAHLRDQTIMRGSMLARSNFGTIPPECGDT